MPAIPGMPAIIPGSHNTKAILPSTGASMKPAGTRERRHANPIAAMAGQAGGRFGLLPLMTDRVEFPRCMWGAFYQQVDQCCGFRWRWEAPPWLWGLPYCTLTKFSWP